MDIWQKVSEQFSGDWLAQIHEIRRHYEAAIQAWEGVLRLRREEWNYQEGEAVDQPVREIARLRELLSHKVIKPTG